MAGENNTSVDERVKKLDSVLNEYNQKFSINSFKPDSEAVLALNFTPLEIRALTEEECGEYCYVLHRYAGYIQTECNRLNARIRWLHRCIELETAANIRSYGDKFTSFQERTLLCQNDKTNEYMKKLQDVLMQSEIRKEELSFITSKITAMANTLSEQKSTKRQHKWD